MWTAIGAILPGLLKLGIELWTGKKMSEEDFQTWIAADKETRKKIAVVRDEYKENKRKLIEEKKKLRASLGKSEK